MLVQMIMSGYHFRKSQVDGRKRVSATSLSPPAECYRYGVLQP